VTSVDEPRALLRAMFDAAVAAADPLLRVPEFLPAPPAGRLVVVGAGKASARMAQAVERSWDGPLGGLVVTRYGHAVPTEHVEIVEAAHPVPDEAGSRAAARMISIVSDLTEDDLVLALISGGGSALAALPAPGLTLADKQAVNTALLRSGAAITSMNLVRKHLSAIKGGRLAAAAYPARTVGLLISDVPGDDPGIIASGPTVAEPSSPADALAVLDRYRVEVPAAVRDHLAAADRPPGPGDVRMSRVSNTVIAAPQRSLEAAAGCARAAGCRPVILGDSIEGEAREVGVVLAGIARQVVAHGQPAPAPCVLLSGGETTVTVRGDGSGGRNVELLLSLALALRGEPRVWALAADTDGVDGAEEVAGAIVTPDTRDRAGALGLDAAAALARNDGHPFFAALGDQVITGPTMTNVNDFRAVLVTTPE
jgi:glycerate-2-kinase